MANDDFLNEVKDLLAQGKYDESIELADKILTQHAEILNTLAFAFDKKGYSLTKSGNPQQALKFNDKAVALNDDDAICHVNRSFTLGELARYEESLEECEKALSIDPNYAKAWNNKGHALHRLGKSDEGLKNVEKALELDPTDEDALDSKEQILAALGRTD